MHHVCLTYCSEQVIEFLRNRQERVQLNGVFSDWLGVLTGVPQGTRLGSWLFLAMTIPSNDLRLSERFHMWNGSCSRLQMQLITTSGWLNLQLVTRNPSAAKSNEIKRDPHMLQALIPPCFSQVSIEGFEFDLVSSLFFKFLFYFSDILAPLKQIII